MDNDQADLRERFKAWVKECDRARRRWRDMLDALAGTRAVLPEPTFIMPAEFHGLRCAARTKRGGLCERTDLHPNGRCADHGGGSTGPKSAGGRERARANLELRWRASSEPSPRSPAEE